MRVMSPRVVPGALSVSMSATSWENCSGEFDSDSTPMHTTPRRQRQGSREGGLAEKPPALSFCSDTIGYAAFFCAAFHFAQRAFWAAAILRRAAADIVRLFPTDFLAPDGPLPSSLRRTEIALSSFLTCPAIRLRSCTKPLNASARFAIFAPSSE